jgi:hypothetical protein
LEIFKNWLFAFALSLFGFPGFSLTPKTTLAFQM